VTGERDARLARLRKLARLEERPFSSRVPIFGPLIAAFRTVWNDVSTRWYVRPIADQQSMFNLAATEELESLYAATDELAALRAETEMLRLEVARMREWLIDQDRDQTQLRHDLAELSLVVGQQLRALGAAQAGSDNPAPDPHE
jgi:hypothetical protein